MTNRFSPSRPKSDTLKRCKRNGVEEECRINDMPDEILSHILSWLTLKEAIATGILSKRWKNLWVSLPNLDFGCLKSYKRDRRTYVQYVQVVDKILKQYNGKKLHKFRIFRPLIHSARHCYFDNWISFAIKNGVSELDLNLNAYPEIGHSKNYFFPAHVFGSSPNFESLRDLCLRTVNVSDDVFDLILSSCFSLERFILEFSHGLVNAKNKSPHLKLKSLELYLCEDVEYLQLLAPNLISFKYQGRERTLCIKDAKQLASLRLSTCTSPDQNTSFIFPGSKNFLFSQFSSHFSKLKSLVVSADLFEDMSDFTQLCVFSNLKQLVVDVIMHQLTNLCYTVVASIIRGSPLLELLEITLPAYTPWEKYQALELASMSPHHNLKEVKLYGFRGEEPTMKFLSYLSEYTVSLQKIHVTSRGCIRLGENLTVNVGLFWYEPDAAEHTKNCVLHLRQTLHANVHLMFPDE